MTRNPRTFTTSRRHKDDAVRSYALDVDTAGQIRALMHQKGAYTLGELIGHTEVV
ncbi:hypothetical protein [Trueperella pyogenes]|uniref:hypothetical protein n=1 Tax=Trueperella pyogenes TaxID=1661 RepID=UPI0023DD75DE|nr:hypothetical protein [Trueperella pyogenes]